MLKIRREQVEALARRCGRVLAGCPPPPAAGRVRHTQPKAADKLIRKHLRNCAKKGIDAGKKIEGSSSVVGEPEWSQAGVARYGEPTWSTRKVNNLNGFVDQHGKVWIHKDRGNPATMVHEGIHKYSNDALIKQSQPLNEGVTEYFTRLIASKVNLAKGRRNYQANYKSAKALAGLVGIKALCRAYFGGDVNQLKQAVDKKRGAGTWDRYVAATKANKWREATALLKPRR